MMRKSCLAIAVTFAACTPDSGTPIGTSTSPDGSTSSQDASTEGSPGEAVARGQSKPHAIAVDEATVFWLNEGEPGQPGTLMSATKSGGEARTLVAAINDPQQIALDAQNVYWTEGAGGLKRIAKGGGASQTMATPGSGGGATALALDATHVFFIDYRGFGQSKIMKISIASSESAELGAALDPGRIAVDATYVYVALNHGNILRVAKVGTSPVENVAVGKFYTPAMTVDGSLVYWVDSSQNKILQVATKGGAITDVATGLAGVQDILVRSGSVYGVNTVGGFPGTVFRVPLGGGSRVNIAENQKAPGAIACDGLYVYWTNYNGDEVMRAPM